MRRAAAFVGIGLAGLLCGCQPEPPRQAPEPPPAVIQAPAPVEAAPKPSAAYKLLLSLPLDSPEAVKKWDEKIFKGNTQYTYTAEGTDRFVRVTSNDAASGLYFERKIPADPSLYLTWRWRARRFPVKKNPAVLSAKQQDDFAARIYVIFDAANIFRSDVIEYVWDEHIAAETIQESPYSDRVHLYVIRSGAPGADAGGWQTEERNIREDFIKIFGRAPAKPVAAIAIMCDSDNTGTSAEADFTDIAFQQKQ